MRHLTRAVELGYKDVTDLERSPDLAPVRGREDFKQLVERVRKGG
jgi:hypothetical protein